jgi:hypothetical protein
VIEETPNVRIENPVHPLRLDTHGQGIECLVRVASRPKPIREAPEVHFVYLVEDGHHSLLNNLVLQRSDADRALPSVGLRYINSSRRLCLIRSTMHPAVPINRPILQPGFILLPGHAVYSRRSLPLQSEEAVPEQAGGKMVEQRGKSFLLSFFGYLPHTAQSLGHSFPALCRARVRSRDVLLGLRSFLPSLR